MTERFDWVDDEAMADLPLRGIEPFEVRQALEYGVRDCAAAWERMCSACTRARGPAATEGNHE
jgi:hypothetical protein